MDELDRILADETELVASSGFTSRVMDAVRQEASAPPPIPFPWKRALPGFAAWAAALVIAAIVATRISLAPPASTSGPAWFSRLTPFIDTARMWGLGWIALALALIVVGVKLSMRLAGGTRRA